MTGPAVGAVVSAGPPPAAAATAARDAWWAAAVALAVYHGSCLLAPPAPEAVGFGLEWQRMSLAPFELVGALPHRLLAPLLAHGLGLGGAPAWIVFTRGLAVLLLATVFFVCRRRGLGLPGSALVAAAVGATASVQAYKQQWIGYSDQLTYTLLLWALLAARRPAWLWTLFLLALLNHELSVFLLPWLWFVRRQEGGGGRTDAIGAGAALAAYAAFYLAVRSAARPAYAVDYFLANPLLPWGAICVNLFALVQWTVAWGPMVAVLAWHQHRREHGRERWHLWLVVGAVGAILCIAFDWIRHTNLVVVPLVLASIRFLQAAGRNTRVYAGLLAVTVAAMALVPPWYAATGVQTDLPWPTSDLWAALLHAGQGAPAATVRGVLFAWLAAAWPLLAVIYALLAALWLAGAWYARRAPRAG